MQKHQWDEYPSNWVQGRRYCKWDQVSHTTQRKNTKESVDSVLVCTGHSPPRVPGPQSNSECSQFLHNTVGTWRKSSGWIVPTWSHRKWSFSITGHVTTQLLKQSQWCHTVWTLYTVTSTYSNQVKKYAGRCKHWALISSPRESKKWYIVETNVTIILVIKWRNRGLVNYFSFC
jgi:hypothetical protein